MSDKKTILTIIHADRLFMRPRKPFLFCQFVTIEHAAQRHNVTRKSDAQRHTKNRRLYKSMSYRRHSHCVISISTLRNHTKANDHENDRRTLHPLTNCVMRRRHQFSPRTIRKRGTFNKAIPMGRRTTRRTYAVVVRYAVYISKRRSHSNCVKQDHQTAVIHAHHSRCACS